MFDRRGLLLAGAAGIAQIGQRVQPRVTPPQLLQQTHVPALGGVVVTAHAPPAITVLGRRRAAGRTPVGVDDLWLLGSNTQAMTAVLYAKRVESNRANWRAPVPELFPDLKVDPAWSRIEVEDLMGHRAGVSDAPVATTDFLAAASLDRRPLTVQRTEFAERILSKPPAGEPGRFEPASADYVLVGAAIERASRMAWETAISAELFTPLGLTSAGFGAPTDAEPWGHQVLGGRAVPVNPSSIADDPAVFGPSARVHMSLADYAGFLRLFVSGGGGYLGPDTLRRLTDPQGDHGEVGAFGWTISPERGWAKGPVLAAETSAGFWSCNTAGGPSPGSAPPAVRSARRPPRG